MRQLHTRATLLAMLILGAGIGLLLTSTQEAQAGVSHGSVAVETPRADTPIVLDGTVYSSVQLHDRVIVAGQFSRVQTVRNGPIVDRNNIYAYDINTGDLIDDFTPNIPGRIRVLESAPDEDAVYLGGVFTTIDGEFRQRLAKVGYDGTLDPRFRPIVSAEVHTIEVHNNVVYVGGSFASINNAPHDRIGAVDASTGASIDSFNLAITGDLGKAGSRSVRHIEVHPDGQRLLVVSNGQSIVDAVGTHDRFGVGFIDIDTYTVTPWRTQWYELAYQRCSAQSLQIRDASFSPDGSQFAIVEKGNFECDKIVSFDTNDDGTNNPKWITAAHDSVFSVEITDHAVYAGGHFCFVTAHGQIASSDAPTYPWVAKPEPCQITGFAVGNQTIDDFIARQQIVALDPADGSVLDWNPRSNAQVAVHDIESIDRGLLIGQDSNGINTVTTGRHAFLDFGGTTPPFNPPVVPTQGCVATVTGGGVQLEWLATNDRTQVRRDGGWLATVTGDGAYTDTEGTAANTYDIRIRENGANVDYRCTDGADPDPGPDPDPDPDPDPPVGAGVCEADLNGNTVTLSWGDNGASTEVIRRNNGWVANVTGDRTFTNTPGVGNHSYVLRLRIDGNTVDIPCDPDPITVGNPGEPVVLECTVFVDDDQAFLEFTPNTSGTHVIRRNDRWIATVNGLDSVTWTRRNGQSAAGDFVLRATQDGVVTDVPCEDVIREPEEPVNVALGKSATQSSTAHGGVATRAVDGNTSGVWREGSVTHTVTTTAQPWWQVDLGAPATISTIDLWNRTGCCPERLADVVIFVSDTDMTDRTLAELEADPAVASYSVDGVLGETTPITADTTGQFVRVQLRGDSAILSLAEVLVNGNFQ